MSVSQTEEEEEEGEEVSTDSHGQYLRPSGMIKTKKEEEKKKTKKKKKPTRRQKVSIAQLDQLNDNQNQRNITYFCFAILVMFFVCQLPHGIWLAYSGYSLAGPTVIGELND